MYTLFERNRSSNTKNGKKKTFEIKEILQSVAVMIDHILRQWGTFPFERKIILCISRKLYLIQYIYELLLFFSFFFEK